MKRHLAPLKVYILIFLCIYFTNTYAWSQSTRDVELIAPDGSTVRIERDAYGAPHIRADSEIGLFFGQGYAVAEDRLEQLDLYRRAALGRLAELFSVLFTEADKSTRTEFYTAEERAEQFESLDAEIKSIFTAYRMGINTYIDSMDVNPDTFKPRAFSSRDMERWQDTHTVGVIQFFLRNFGRFGGDELDRLLELQENGMDWLNENRPINNPDAPTTIPGPMDPNLIIGAYTGPTVRPEIIRAHQKQKKALKNQFEKIRVPTSFGSFATLISSDKSATGNVMLLGAPQMTPPRENTVSVTHEVELDAPGLHVGGMTVAGIPGVIIGRNEYYAWTLTSGLSDNTDIFIETTMDTSYSQYWFDGAWRDFEVIEDPIKQLNTVVPFTHFRTVHGPVIGADLENHQVFSQNITFWGDELLTARAFYDVWKGTSLEEFESAIIRAPHSFNAFYAGLDQNIHFWHLGKYQDRSDGVDPRLPHMGDGTQEWGGFIDPVDLPNQGNASQGYFVNWNNKPEPSWNNGDNVPWADSFDRVIDIDNFVGPAASFSFEQLKSIPRQLEVAGYPLSFARGTYQQAIEIAENRFVRNENVVPPGQSGFVSLGGISSPHLNDQWQLHIDGAFKDMGFRQSTDVAFVEDILSPSGFELLQNFPNPFTQYTEISFSLPTASAVSLRLFDTLGRQVQVLFDEALPTGLHTVHLKADDLSSGVYVYQFVAGSFTQTRKLVLLRQD